MIVENGNVKIWRIDGWLDNSECKYLRTFTIKIIPGETASMPLYNGSHSHFTIRPPSVEVTTTTEKEELALKLKFSDRMYLTHSINYYSTSVALG